MYKCKYCGKKFEKKQQLAGHIIWCKENPNKTGKSNFKHKPRKNKDKINNTGNTSNHQAWNKGLTKETDERVKHYGESISNSYKTGKITTWCQGLTKDNDDRIKALSERISKTILCKVKDDTWHNSFGKSRLVEYNGIKFHGNWEAAFARFLDKNNIIWKRPTEKFEYILDNKTHYYTPDFYLPAFDLYIEIKGYPTDKDFLKWTQFPKDKKLDIYFGDDLGDLGIIDDYRDIYNNVDIKFREKHIHLKRVEEGL